MTRHQRVKILQRTYYRVIAEMVRYSPRFTEALKEWKAARDDLRAFDAGRSR